MEQSSMRAVFVGCARDCKHALPGVIEWIERSGAVLRDYRVIIVENDSSDGSKDVLSGWASRNDRVKIIPLDGLQQTHPVRTMRLAEARNAYLKQMRDREYNAYDLMIVLDMDGVVGIDPTTDQLLSAIEFVSRDDGAAGVFANSTPVYYDIWALRHKDWCPGDCWAEFKAHKAALGQSKALHRFVNDRQICIGRDEAPIRVDSAFGGLGIYRISAIKNSYYRGNSAQNSAICEHVHFNNHVSTRGQLYILPNLTADAPIEHVITGSNPTKVMVLEHQELRIALLAPAEHMLDHYMAEHALYDTRLPLLAQILSTHNASDSVIDVGSNIGDTAALMMLYGASMPIIGIEASSFYYRFSEFNKRFHNQIFSKTNFHWGAVGPKETGGRIVLSSGTGRSEKNDGASSGDSVHVYEPPAISFRQVVPNDGVSLIKIDIDGLDYAVVSHEFDFLMEKNPILWAEAQTGEHHDELAWFSLLTKLSEEWNTIFLFDKFGFGYLTGDTRKSISSVSDFLSYCRRQRQFSHLIRGKVRAHYADIVLFPKRFKSIAQAFHEQLPEFQHDRC